MVCGMESSGGKSAASALGEATVFEENKAWIADNYSKHMMFCIVLATPYFFFYTTQQEVCNICGGNEQFSSTTFIDV